MAAAGERHEDQVFRIDATSGVPPYRQLHDAVVEALASGRLLPGERLPTVRALATRLALAPNTVASAYRSLESHGIVEGRGRTGTFVRLGDDPVDAQARQLAQRFVAELRAIGVSQERAIHLLGEAFAAADRAVDS